MEDIGRIDVRVTDEIYKMILEALLKHPSISDFQVDILNGSFPKNPVDLRMHLSRNKYRNMVYYALENDLTVPYGRSKLMFIGIEYLCFDFKTLCPLWVNSQVNINV